MKIECKAKDEDGNVIFEGTLNSQEVGFLLQLSINQLLADGVQFLLQEPDEGASRIRFPQAMLDD